MANWGDFVQKCGDILWNPCLLILFSLVGLYYSIPTGFFQLTGLTRWMRETVGSVFRKKVVKNGGLTQFQALSTALASTIGTGSIAGVATAIFFGGPGAVFWMWASAFLGMMTGCAEKTLAVIYHKKDPKGGFFGGPMEYMEQGVGGRPGRALALFFSVGCVGASLAGGALVQANSISSALEHAFKLPQKVTAFALIILVGVTIFGGIQRVGKVSEKLVPVMAGLFLGGGISVLFVHRNAIPAAFLSIFHGAFRPQAVFGGYSVGTALRFGVARGVFTNEAGLGSSAMAHGAAQVETPIKEGFWGIFEVFFATIIVCSVTALVILTSGVYSPNSALEMICEGEVPATVGAPMSGAAFGTVFGKFGPVFVSICLLLFAFTSLLGWGYYGERAVCYPVQKGGQKVVKWCFRGVYLVSIWWGCGAATDRVWALTDLADGLMALPNLTALLLLSPEFFRVFREYVKKCTDGKKRPG